MNGKPAPRIHVAGVHDAEECRLLIDSGFRWIGLPLVLDRHPQDLTVDEACGLVARFTGRVRFFLITYLDQAQAIASLCRRLGVDTVQLHGFVETRQLAALREAAPSLSVGKSLVVRGEDGDTLEREAARCEPWVDWFLTDTYDPRTGASGATGRRHDWRVSRRLVDACRRPVILAGGLDADNVERAIRTVRPAGVDVHTGIEGTDGRKRSEAARRFVERAAAAFVRWPPVRGGLADPQP